METDETYIIRLRDCFTGGYTLPQFCLDNGIQKPLFVAEENFCNSFGKFTFSFAATKD